MHVGIVSSLEENETNPIQSMIMTRPGHKWILDGWAWTHGFAIQTRYIINASCMQIVCVLNFFALFLIIL